MFIFLRSIVNQLSRIDSKKSPIRQKTISLILEQSYSMFSMHLDLDRFSTFTCFAIATLLALRLGSFSIAPTGGVLK